jgi:hypothetical protein
VLLTPTVQKISAYDIHEWIYETLRIPDQEVTMVQIDGIKRHVHIKLLTEQMARKIIQDTNERMAYKHPDGLMTTVLTELAEMGIKSIRMANLPPEVPENKIQATMAPYGKIISLRNEVWARTYRYAVPNGIRQINMSLQHHILSHLVIAGHRVLSYERQPQTCYGCEVNEHMYQNCPKRRNREQKGPTRLISTYATVATGGTDGTEYRVGLQGNHNPILPLE